MTTLEQPELHLCPACGAANELDALVKREYRCSQCGLELAHLDVAINGVTRGIFGWLRGAGDIIENRYQVRSVLGKGGFGVTYLVEDLRLNGKRRAIKEVPELLFDEYETTLLSRLNHPSIPDITDRSVVDGMVYLVLEFGGSRTLGDERKQYPDRRIPLSKLLPWMRQLCEALIYLHAQDPPIIHRDLKPDNILLDETGRIMLIDFGIAKESKPATMTRTIGRAATQGFSPPEQAMGTGTDERSDIYALAATFYALLTGETPPAAHERVAGKELAPPSQIVADLSPQLEAAILQALDLNVNRRQQTMKSFSQALEGVDSGVHNSTRTTEYAERTVMIGRTTGATGLPALSIRLPSVKITADSSIPVATAAELTSNKRTYWVVASLVAIALITVAAGVDVYRQAPVIKINDAGLGTKPPPIEPPPTPPNQLPSAQISTTQETPLTVNFNGSGSSDLDGRITAYNWNFGDGEVGSGVQVSHPYKAAVEYTATLTVTDDAGASSTASVPITISGKTSGIIPGGALDALKHPPTPDPPPTTPTKHPPPAVHPPKHPPPAVHPPKHPPPSPPPDPYADGDVKRR